MTKTVRMIAPQTTHSDFLFKAGRGSGADLRFALQPGVKIRLAEDFEETFHLVVAVATKLRTLNPVRANSGGDKMNRDSHAWVGVLRHPHGDHLERVDYIKRTDLGDDRFVHGHDHLVTFEEHIIQAV